VYECISGEKPQTGLKCIAFSILKMDIFAIHHHISYSVQSVANTDLG